MQRLAAAAASSGGLRYQTFSTSYASRKVSNSHLTWSTKLSATTARSTLSPSLQLIRRKITTTPATPVPPAAGVASPIATADAAKTTIELSGQKINISTALYEPVANAGSSSISSGVTSMLDWWQPVAWMTNLLEQVHTFTGLPWWGAIIVHAWILRTLLLPGNVVSLVASAKMAKAKPELESVQKQLQGQAIITGHRPGFLEMQAAMKEVYDRHDVKMWKMSLPPLLSAPFFITMFLTIRRMAEQNPTLADGGALWFQDLAMSDPYARLAMISSGLMLLSFQVGMDGNPGMADRSKWVKMFMRGAAIASVPLTMWFPQALHIYWIANTAYSLLVTLVTRIPAVKKWIGFPAAIVVAGTKPKPVFAVPTAPGVSSTTNPTPSTPLVFAKPGAGKGLSDGTVDILTSRPPRSKKK